MPSTRMPDPFFASVRGFQASVRQHCSGDHFLRHCLLPLYWRPVEGDDQAPIVTAPHGCSAISLDQKTFHHITGGFRRDSGASYVMARLRDMTKSFRPKIGWISGTSRPKSSGTTRTALGHAGVTERVEVRGQHEPYASEFTMGLAYRGHGGRGHAASTEGVVNSEPI